MIFNGSDSQCLVETDLEESGVQALAVSIVDDSLNVSKPSEATLSMLTEEIFVHNKFTEMLDLSVKKLSKSKSLSNLLKIHSEKRTSMLVEHNAKNDLLEKQIGECISCIKLESEQAVIFENIVARLSKSSLRLVQRRSNLKVEMRVALLDEQIERTERSVQFCGGRIELYECWAEFWDKEKGILNECKNYGDSLVNEEDRQACYETYLSDRKRRYAAAKLDVRIIANASSAALAILRARHDNARQRHYDNEVFMTVCVEDALRAHQEFLFAKSQYGEVMKAESSV